MEIAVIGGGHGCYAAAASLTENGHNVSLWRRNSEALKKVQNTNSIKLTDYKGTRSIKLKKVSTNLSDVMQGAKLIVLPLPCHTQISLAEQLAPLWQDGQVGYLPPGTFGGYIFAKAAREIGNKSNIIFGETGTLPYLARKQSDDHVRISVYATRLPTGLFPLKDAERGFNVIKKAFPAAEIITDLLDGALMNAGPIIHPPLIIMNAGPLQHFDEWDIHNEGTQIAIRNVTDQLDSERILLRQALNYKAPHFPLKNHYNDDEDEWMYGNSSHQKLTDSGDWREHIDLETHRYMIEDIAHGLTFLCSLGRWINQPMPISEGLLSIGSAIVRSDLYKNGRSLENLGLVKQDFKGLKELLLKGFV
ncbi:MAG: glycerol-3-phosphate dehydrogenase [Rhodospirillaceae bacterium]|nr:glycerol-3-phosphate dehydrogenase [Rhodospirillaceae bacterium]OUT78991.1 MAG: glycerol-3-phosphate dehydrogenase [Rhodospirillaceae bacterium TMED23]|tara:strand:- start:24579 stop:25664 length:1086 start_codon:yes stop_codon:yes gene_type:complete